jgi:retron-type reverse transcriptase
VQFFERHLEDNLFSLHHQLKNKNYKHGAYSEFFVNDPKRRHIHKAQVNDRIVHHLLYKYLYSLFDKSFIYDSYSCRVDKGTHRSVRRLEKYLRIVSRNYTRNCWTLKLDIKQFFASVDHDILMELIRKRVKDKDTLSLIDEIITSFRVNEDQATGIPLGNLTSQIFANIYLNEMDQFIKHDLKIKHYIRYADDFIILETEKLKLKNTLISIGHFLQNHLILQLHPKKIILRQLKDGIDFCGYVVIPHYILPRAKTRRRIVKKVAGNKISYQSLQSYLGYFSHSKASKVEEHIKNLFFLSRSE